jgi:hypothetical protein
VKWLPGVRILAPEGNPLCFRSGAFSHSWDDDAAEQMKGVGGIGAILRFQTAANHRFEQNEANILETSWCLFFGTV